MGRSVRPSVGRISSLWLWFFYCLHLRRCCTTLHTWARVLASSTHFRSCEYIQCKSSNQKHAGLRSLCGFFKRVGASALNTAMLLPTTCPPGDCMDSGSPRCNCTYETATPDTLHGTCDALYVNAWTHETGSTGAANHHVCLFQPAREFDWMGYRVRAQGCKNALPISNAC